MEFNAGIFSFTGTLKSVKYVAASPVNQTRARKGRSACPGDAVYLEISRIKSMACVL
jgi:hypothetical protein